MPWSGAAGSQTFSRTDGTRTGAQVWQDAEAAAVDIVSDDHDTHDQDVAAGLNLALKKDGGNTATGDIPMGTNKITGLGDPTNAQDAATKTYTDTVTGLILQSVNSTSATYANTAVAIPADDTIPQNTEGAELLTVTITPGNASNRLFFEFEAFFSSDGAPVAATVALFQDSTANALYAVADTVSSVNAVKHVRLRYEMAAGTTSSTTFKVRYGPSSNTLYVNGISTGRIYGGVAQASLTVQERAA